MSKKSKIILISSIVAVVLLIIIVAVGFNNNQERAFMASEFWENNIATSIQEAEQMDMSKPLVVLFHAQFCANCQKFMPIYKKLSKELANEYNFVMLDTQDPQNYPLVVGNVFAVPTLYIFDIKIGNKINIPLQTIRTYGELKGEMDRYTRIRSFIDIPKAEEKQNELMKIYTEKLLKDKKIAKKR